MAEIAIARIRLGNARNMSVIRISDSSHHPPFHPASMPVTIPKAVATRTTAVPETREIRAP